MGVARLGWRESLREIGEGLNAEGAAVFYHLGLREPMTGVTFGRSHRAKRVLVVAGESGHQLDQTCAATL